MSYKITFKNDGYEVIVNPDATPAEIQLHEQIKFREHEAYYHAVLYFAAKAAAARKMISIASRLAPINEIELKHYRDTFALTLLEDFLEHVKDMDGAHEDWNVDVFNDALKEIEERGQLMVIED